MFSLAKKKVVITGGASGIGRAIAETFALHEAEVHIVDVNPKLAMDVVNEIRKAGGKAHTHRCNVANHIQVKDLLTTIGDIDILINSAAVSHLGTADTTCEEDFDWLMAVNIKGTYNCIHAAIPLLRNSGGGVILNIASVAASIGLPERFAYSTTKGAITAMTLSIARDYFYENIRCNSISPASIHTPPAHALVNDTYPGQGTIDLKKLSRLQPIGRLSTPKEAASLALYLCSDEAAFITGNDYPLYWGLIKLNT
ncbi:SDR family NAD(P)-dependent oxidoreductase [Chryseolinea soli]|uniref:SDR family oxidoreductase n=1 Tax=Chryseolinea soli TaxID=2321403 RepID=A0A385SZL7_9BACT|nr:SDR family oxidoreductase [Chryseolinea soli]AYB35577.1 SDR family oxidoreductase [Chryseolinea soli]